MRAPKENTAIRQEQITEAAMQLIAAHGLASLNIAAIAQQVGIVPSAVYRHFPGKEAVLDAVLDLLQTRMKQNVDIVCAESDSALERLHSLLTRHLTMLVENQAFPYLIFSQLSEADHAERRTKLESTMHGFLSQVAAIVRQGQQRGEIRSDISPRTVAVMFVGMVLPSAVLFRLSSGKFNPLDHLQQAWPPFVRGITTSNNQKPTQ